MAERLEGFDGYYDRITSSPRQRWTLNNYTTGSDGEEEIEAAFTVEAITLSPELDPPQNDRRALRVKLMSQGFGIEGATLAHSITFGVGGLVVESVGPLSIEEAARIAAGKIRLLGSILDSAQPPISPN